MLVNHVIGVVMRLGLLCNHNVFDKNAFSGTAYYMFHALAENPGCSVRVLGEYRRPNRILDRLRKPAAGARAISSGSFEGLDIILSLVSSNLILKYAPLTRVPVVHSTDATPGFLREFYGYEVPAEKDAEECRTYDAASLVLFSSDFMLERAVREFGETYRPRMMALPWGANLDSFPDNSPPKPALQPLRLLFIGKDWERKGGDVALAALQALRARGVAAELHLIGVDASVVGAVKGVVHHGYLDKNKATDRAKLERVLNDAHFFILPTRADCTPMVIAEANSRGIPVLITNVGGISSLMRSGVNGEMLPPQATPVDFADLKKW